MKLNIDSLYGKEIKSIDFDLSEDVSSIEFSGIEYNLISPIHLAGKVSKTGRNCLLEAEVDFAFKASCGRCLADIEVPVKYNIDAYLMKEDYDESEFEDIDVFKIDSSDVNLMDIINSTLSFNMPQRLLCSEYCKGICSGCGVDLNTENCKCEDSIDVDDVDPRFAKLKELLK
ncbi:MAG: DUF177 domain-containing protein [Peptostreptococcus sp.]|uniref:YceD family protein n=1 Tax=Peptostreptococcus sp. TaxID=1262 RepID=UPI002FCC50E1